MTKKEDEALEASLKYGSGPFVVRQGSVAAEFFDQYGIAPVVIADPEVPANSPEPEPVTKSAASAATEKEN